ncbi:MAG TPA: 4Fe-4S binding protein [Methanoregulaceae archaeon]|nr:4Fe-4S binding protein [Methanoregulaceae archaeon]
MVVGFIPKAAGFGYAIIVFFLLAYLWYSGRITRRGAVIFLIISTALGFLIFAPVAPWQFQLLVLGDVKGLGIGVQIAAFGLLFFLGFALLFGRIFCGHICPAGAVQELVYLAPLKKTGRTWKKATMAIRLVVFILLMVLAVVFSINLLRILGLRDFFYLAIGSVSFFIYFGIVILSAVLYRPFCRFICPYGLLLSISATWSLFKFRRTDKCIHCKKCERICPTDESKEGDRKSECYMCGRCVEVCPVEGALRYGRG